MRLFASGRLRCVTNASSKSYKQFVVTSEKDIMKMFFYNAFLNFQKIPGLTSSSLLGEKLTAINGNNLDSSQSV